MSSVSSTQCILAKAYPLVAKFLCQTEKPKKHFFSSFLPHPLPALLLAPFFAWSLTLVPSFLLLSRTETLATQATGIIIWHKRTLLKTVWKTGFVCIEGNQVDRSPRHGRQARFEQARKEHSTENLQSFFNKVISYIEDQAIR